MKFPKLIGISLWQSLLLGLLFALVVASPSIAQNRSVVLVFDNSGSMGQNQAYYPANYSLQLLLSLLHEDDEFRVVRMSAVDEFEFDLGDKNAAIKTILDWPVGKATDIRSLLVAMDRLEQSNKSEKWLVIMTDGIWENVDQLEVPIRSFVKNTGANTLLLNINTNPKENALAKMYEDLGMADIHTTSASFDEVQTSMRDISSTLISIPGKGLHATFKDKEISFETPVPLKRLLVIEQVSDNITGLHSIESTAADGKALQIEKPYFIQKQNRYGHVHILQNTANDRVIPEGKVTLTFNSTLDPKRFLVLPEVAARLRARPLNPDSISGNTFFFCEEQQDIEIESYLEKLDGSRLDNELVLNNTKVTINYEGQKDALQLNTSLKVFHITIQPKANEVPVSVGAFYEEYFDFKSQVFMIKKYLCIPPDTMKASDVRIERDIWVTEFDGSMSIAATPVIIMGEDTITDEEFEYLFLDRLDDGDLNADIEKRDGQFFIHPDNPWWCHACFLSGGRDSMVYQLDSKNNKFIDKAKITIVLNVKDVGFWEKCGTFIIILIVLAVLLWYLIGVIKKKRFVRGAEIIYTKRNVRTRKESRERFEPLKSNFFSRYLVPYIPESAVVEGIRFVAGGNRNYIVLPKSQQSPNMSIDTETIEQPGKRDRRINTNYTLLIKGKRYDEKYTYKR